MKDVALVAFCLAPASILAGGAVYLAMHSMSGWGWFLICALLLAGSFKYSSSSKTGE